VHRPISIFTRTRTDTYVQPSNDTRQNNEQDKKRALLVHDLDHIAKKPTAGDFPGPWRSPSPSTGRQNPSPGQSPRFPRCHQPDKLAGMVLARVSSLPPRLKVPPPMMRCVFQSFIQFCTDGSRNNCTHQNNTFSSLCQMAYLY
jgi:hypothetical protein